MLHPKRSLILPWRLLAVSLFLLCSVTVALAAPTITTPLDGGTYTTAPTTVTGSTGAPQGDSATAVWVLLYRYGNGSTPEGYLSTDGTWTPRAQYSGAKNLLPARLNTNGTWSYTLPTTAQGLVPSQYAIAVKAHYSQHPGSSSPYSLFWLIAPDSTSPTITFARPTSGAALTSLNPIIGTATDSGSGVQSVQVEIQRTSDRLWWTGSAWGARTQVPATLSSNGVWTLSSGLPSGTALPDGVYSLNALASDRAGNRSRATVAVRVDQSAPTVTISTPSSTQQVLTLKPISGTAADSGSGVQSVQVSIQRESDSAFWNGSAWVSAGTLLSTQLATDGTWSRPAGYPLGTNLQSGLYAIRAVTTDKAGNQGQTSERVQVNTSLPTVTITSPADGATFRTADIGTISGTALDNPGGEGLQQVRLTVQRQSDSLFWTGSTWGAETPLATDLQMNGQWSKNTGLPTGADLLNGRYVLTATATDKVGNSSSTAITVLINAPATGRIVFVSQRDGNSEIYIMNADGTEQTRLTNDLATDIAPSFSHDGRKIVWQRNGDIWMMNADGTGQTQLTTMGGNSNPSLSPDGSKIAFESRRSGDPTNEIYIMNADGAGQTRLTSDGGNVEPAFSPDGSKIAFTSNRNTTNEIYVMNVDGTSQTRLTFTDPIIANGAPTWAPDGSRIIFAAYYGTNFGRGWVLGQGQKLDLYSIHADGSGLTRLTSDPNAEQRPTVSPDGRKIALDSDRDGDVDNHNIEIYTMNPDGTNFTRLTTNPTFDFDPSWGPDTQ